jgi:hypothetical protein
LTGAGQRKASATALVAERDTALGAVGREAVSAIERAPNIVAPFDLAVSLPLFRLRFATTAATRIIEGELIGLALDVDSFAAIAPNGPVATRSVVSVAEIRQGSRRLVVLV